MHRKDYVAIATCIIDEVGFMVKFAAVAAADNKAFDRLKFIRACGFNENGKPYFLMEIDEPINVKAGEPIVRHDTTGSIAGRPGYKGSHGHLNR